MNSKIKYLVLISFSLFITEEVKAYENLSNNNQKVNDKTDLVSYKCPQKLIGGNGDTVYSDLANSQKFYQIKTDSGALRIRSTPGGDIIGAIPSGWQVYVAKFDYTKRWAYIRDINSPYYNTSYGFGSAPDFRSDGWVSVDHLVYLGEYCTKPSRLALLPSDLPISFHNDSLFDTLSHSLETEILAKFN